MNLLQLVQEFCRRTGLPIPTQVVGNTDLTVVQFLALLNEVVEDLLALPAGETWQAANKEAVFTTVAAENQGDLSTLAPFGFLGILNQTIYSRSQQLPVYGPISPAQWQQLKAVPASGPYYKYRIWQNQLHMYPAPEAGLTYAFEYASNYGILAVDGMTYKEMFSADTDSCILVPWMVLLRGLRWKWKKEKGLEYDEEFREYQILKLQAMGRDKTSPVLYGDSSLNDKITPGIFVPRGSWPL